MLWAEGVATLTINQQQATSETALASVATSPHARPLLGHTAQWGCCFAAISSICGLCGFSLAPIAACPSPSPFHCHLQSLLTHVFAHNQIRTLFAIKSHTNTNWINIIKILFTRTRELTRRRQWPHSFIDSLQIASVARSLCSLISHWHAANTHNYSHIRTRIRFRFRCKLWLFIVRQRYIYRYI